MALGKGLPFGFLFSGLQVTQISYLWSMELWGAVKGGSMFLPRRIVLTVLFVGGILLAATSGPASAVLLIPRQQLWHAGRTHIWINATANQLWPMHMDGTSILETCSTVTAEASNACPASEWYAIYNFLSTGRKTYSASYERRFGIRGGQISGQLHGKSSVRTLHQTHPLGGGHEQFASVATTQQAAVTDALANFAELWGLSLVNLTATAGHGSPLSDTTDSWQSITGNYSQANSLVGCVQFDLTTTFPSDYVAIPMLMDVNRWSAIGGYFKNPDGSRLAPYIELPNLVYADLWDAPGNRTEYRVRWIELPENLFNGSSIGAAIIFPEAVSELNTTMVFCNIAAGWTSSSLVLELRQGGVGPADSIFSDANIRYFPSIKVAHSPSVQGLDPTNHNVPQRIVNISEGWAQYLNPMVEDLNTSLLNLLLQQPNEKLIDIHAIADVFASLTVNGLSRTAWDSTLQGNVKTVGPNGEGGLDGNYWLGNKGDVFEVDPEKSQNWVTFRVDSSLEGFAYNTITQSPRIAIAIMMLYCLLVVGHILYTGITGISSNSWDTIAEITALAINSSPTSALRNTCAGISELHIFKLPVRILVFKDDEGEGEHLELVFGNGNGAADEEKMPTERTIKPNRTYGTLPPGSSRGERKKDL
ncbi:MAG: hypothetical protein Q9186_004433 [Xanthomendoza sp. 1 TL-2023]